MKQVLEISIAVDEEGNLFVPSEVGQRLHLGPGTTLIVVREEKGGLWIRVQQPVLVEKDGALVARVQAWGDITHATREERERRVKDLLQRVKA